MTGAGRRMKRSMPLCPFSSVNRHPAPVISLSLGGRRDGLLRVGGLQSLTRFVGLVVAA